jgi:hypothetical protein
MDKMKQTAVEWLYDLSKKRELDKFDLEQAKEMEKQQIIDSHNQGYADGYRDNGNSPIEYYTETFKNK